MVCSSYDGKVAHLNTGSLIRTDARDEYTETNTMFGTSFLPLLQSHPHPIFKKYYDFNSTRSRLLISLFFPV